MDATGNFRLLVGLGNPGAKYEGTRHNIGFMLVDRMLEKVSGRWRGSGQGQLATLISELDVAGERVMVMKPQSFMNLSGGPVAEVVKFYKILPSQVLVAHDEIDLPIGSLRIKSGGGDGGHNGVRSITQNLGSDFTRLRLGVGRPENQYSDKQCTDNRGPSVSDWVLGSFSKEEDSVVEELLTRAALAVEMLCNEGLKATQNRFNS